MAQPSKNYHVDEKTLEEEYRAALRAERAALEALQLRLPPGGRGQDKRWEHWEEANRRVKAARQAYLGARQTFQPPEPPKPALMPTLRRLQHEFHIALQQQRDAWEAWNRSQKQGSPDMGLQESWLRAVQQANLARQALINARAK